MRESLRSNLFGVVVPVLAAGSLVALRFLSDRYRFKNLPLLWRPSGTRASFVARAVLALGLVAGVVGFIYDIQKVPPRWASPLLWTGFGLTMTAALAVGATARTSGSPSHRAEHMKHRGRGT